MKIAVIFDTPNAGWEDEDFKKEVAAEVPEAEYEIAEALMANGHEVFLVGLHDDLRHLLQRLEEFQPQLVFNCCESFLGDARFDYGVTAVLEMHRYPYTGSPPSALLAARDKAMSKKILAHHSVPVPRFQTVAPGSAPELAPDLAFPIIVKPLREDASIGIAQSSVVTDEEDLTARVEFVHRKLCQPAILEQLIEGRELYVGLLGNRELDVLPIIEMTFDKTPQPEKRIATYQAKWNLDYRERRGIKNIFARRIADDVVQRTHQISRNAFHALGLRDYGRVDLRLGRDRSIYVLEVNPNPYISFGEDMANAAERMGLDYYQFIARIVAEAMARYAS